MSIFGKPQWYTLAIAGLQVRCNNHSVEVETQSRHAATPMPVQCDTQDERIAFAVQQGYEFYKRRLAQYKSEAAELGFTLPEEV